MAIFQGESCCWEAMGMLVAGFDIYDTVGHQIASRTYMDILRQDAEDNFLRFIARRAKTSYL